MKKVIKLTEYDYQLIDKLEYGEEEISYQKEKDEWFENYESLPKEFIILCDMFLEIANCSLKYAAFLNYLKEIAEKYEEDSDSIIRIYDDFSARKQMFFDLLDKIELEKKTRFPDIIVPPFPKTPIQKQNIITKNELDKFLKNPESEDKRGYKDIVLGKD